MGCNPAPNLPIFCIRLSMPANNTGLWVLHCSPVGDGDPMWSRAKIGRGATGAKGSRLEVIGEKCREVFPFSQVTLRLAERREQAL